MYNFCSQIKFVGNNISCFFIANEKKACCKGIYKAGEKYNQQIKTLYDDAETYFSQLLNPIFILSQKNLYIKHNPSL